MGLFDRQCGRCNINKSKGKVVSKSSGIRYENLQEMITKGDGKAFGDVIYVCDQCYNQIEEDKALEIAMDASGDDFIITTTNEIYGANISKYNGIARTWLPLKHFNNIEADHEEILKAIKKYALRLGANGVIGLKIVIVTFPPASGEFVLHEKTSSAYYATGTAITFKLIQQ
jgi:uncharacterized protein YbjQ (UPF0145 family)